MPISAAPLNSTSYKIPEAVYAKHDGVYKEVQRIYGKRGGEYREIYNKRTYQLYGMHLVPGTTEYDITYLEDAAGKSPAYMNFETGVFNYGDWENAFFMPKPCMLKYDGTVDYYLDPNDYTKKVDSTASDVASYNYGGNAMMEWPLIWYKFVPGETTGEGYFYVSSQKLDDDYHCWCNIDCNGNVTNHFYTAIYAGTKTNVNTIRSISGVVLTNSNTGRANANVQTLVEYAMANNLDDNVQWCAEVIADRMLINMLLVLISKSLDTQATFGNGVCGSTTLSNRLTGELNTRGLFWGSNTDTDGVKIFGMENYWGMLWHYMLGYITQSLPKQAPRHNYIKLTWDTSDGSTTTGYNATKEGYIDLGTLTTGYNTQYSRLTRLSFSEKGYFPAEVGYNASGNNCNDGYIQGNTANYPYAAAMGGCYGLGQNCGAFALNFTEQLTGGVANGAVSLSCKPISHISQEVPAEIL